MRTRPWFRVHSFAGVVAGLLLFIVCWTGTFATLSHEIDWLLTPAARAEAAPAFDVDAVEQAALQRHPGSALLWLAWPLQPGHAVDVVLKTPTTRMWHEYVDPGAARAQGGNSYFNVQRFFRSLHMSLFLKFGLGIYIVGAAGILLLLSAVTPLVFFKRWWTRWFSFHARGGVRAVTSEAHKLAGLWSLWFVLLIALTGIWYLVEQLMIDTADVQFIYPPPPAYAGATGPRLPLPHFLHAARTLRPELQPRTIGITSNGLVYVNGDAGDTLVRERANTLYFEPVGARVVEDRRASRLGPMGRWIEAVDPLHFGTLGGLPTKLLWFVLGLLLSGLCLTGAYLHAGRLAAPGGARARWPGLAWALLASLALLGWMVDGGIAELRRFGPVVDQVQQMPDVPVPVVAFLAGWMALTAALLVLWILWVSRRQVSPRGAKTGARAGIASSHPSAAREPGR
jgi:uncharacterized iron-regulated membrane protein